MYSAIRQMEIRLVDIVIWPSKNSGQVSSFWRKAQKVMEALIIFNQKSRFKIKKSRINQNKSERPFLMCS